MYYLCSKRKCTDKLRSYCAAVLTVQLICAFVFAYIKGRFSHDVVHTTIGNGKNIRSCLISRSTFYLHQLDT